MHDFGFDYKVDNDTFCRLDSIQEWPDDFLDSCQIKIAHIINENTKELINEVLMNFKL